MRNFVWNVSGFGLILVGLILLDTVANGPMSLAAQIFGLI